MNEYDNKYYEANDQNGDRVALKWYSGLLARRLPKGSAVLDYGCGTGYFMRRLANHFVVSGFDLSEFARQSSRSLVPQAVLYEDTTRIADGSLDGVASLHVFEHIPDPAPAFAEVHRMLRPGGVALIVVPDTEGRGHARKGSDWFAYKDPTHCTFLSSAQWSELARNAGFVVEVEGSDGLWDSPYSRLPRFIDRVMFGAPLILRVLTTTLTQKPNRGECAVFFLRKSTD